MTMTAYQGSFFLFPSYTHECSRKLVLCSCIQPGVSFGHGVFGIRKRVARAKGFREGAGQPHNASRSRRISKPNRVKSSQASIGQVFFTVAGVIFSTYLFL